MSDTSTIPEVGLIKKVNVKQETFKAISNMVMSGRWKEGEKIPSENDFKEMLGVSRATVRAALNNLNMLGIVETKQGDGNYIKMTGIGLYMDFLIPYLFINEENINVVMEFREGIETITARYAAQRANEEDIAELEIKKNHCNDMVNDVAKYLEADFEFHYAVAKASHNDLLIQSMYVVKKYCYDALVNYVTHKISVDGILHHDQIFDAIKHHNQEQAEQCMNEHILHVIKSINE